MKPLEGRLDELEKILEDAEKEGLAMDHESLAVYYASALANSHEALNWRDFHRAEAIEYRAVAEGYQALARQRFWVILALLAVNGALIGHILRGLFQ